MINNGGQFGFIKNKVGLNQSMWNDLVDGSTIKMYWICHA